MTVILKTFFNQNFHLFFIPSDVEIDFGFFMYILVYYMQCDYFTSVFQLK